VSSNVFVNLPQPAGNGAGASVSTVSLGAQKTLVIGSSGGVYEPLVTIQASNDGVNWSPLVTFNGPNVQNVLVACQFMRMFVDRLIDGVVPTVEVGASVDTLAQVTLAATAGNGSATPTNTATMGLSKSVQIVGAFQGTVNVEVSEDSVDGPWATIFSFIPGGPTLQSMVVAAQQMRVTREGVPVVSPGLPSILVAATSGGGGGGSGNPQRFQYVVTGLEPDLTNLVIALPVVRPNASYLVQVSQADCANTLGMAIFNGTRTIAQFTLSLAAAATAGDTFTFYVDDPT